MKQLLVIIIGAILVSLFVNKNDYVMIPSTSIRMRVIAASNSKQDQNDKIIVKSALEETIKDWSNFSNYDEVDNYFKDNKQNIDSKIKDIVKKSNQKISFTSNYGYNYFPEKEFNRVLYPSGYYKSYVITIGNGEGENWWCVMFPPLCLIDSNNDEYTYRSLIKDVLTQYN